MRRIFLHVFTLCLLGASANATITINETWVNDPGADAKTAWAAVETYYQNVFSSSYASETWNIRLDWTELSGSGIAEGGPSGNQTLGSVLKAQGNATTSLIHDNVYYVSTLANHLVKSSFIAGENMSISFSSNSTKVTWDYSTTSTANGTESFYATAIHEVAHGLGFISGENGAAPSGAGWTSPGPLIFDYYLGLGTSGSDPLIGKTDAELQAAFISNNVYWTGPNGNAALGSPIKIHAPTTYSPGSSMSHLDFSIDMTQSLLMYPNDSGNPPLYSYAPLEIGMWNDMGYTVVPEPSAIVLVLLAGGGLLAWGIRRREAVRLGTTQGTISRPC